MVIAARGVRTRAVKKKARKEEKKMKKNIYKAGAVFFGIILVISVAFLIRNVIVEKRAENQYEELTQNTQKEAVVVTEEVSENEDELTVAIPQKQFDWTAILEECKDIYAWIYIPGTNVDYPILQSAEDMEEDYYLDHNLDGSQGYPGCIYTQKLNKKDFSDYNTVIYGHNMKNGTMFKTLHDYEDETFFQENRYIYIYLPDGKTKVYEIYGAYTFTDAHILLTYGCDSEESFKEYLELIGPDTYTGHFKEDIEVTEKDKIITLSTCTNSSATRYLVQGVYLGEK